MVNFQQFDSGAVRDSQDGKIDFALITPTFKKDLAELLTVKAKHYGDRNWEKGIPTSRSFSSLLRHVEALGRGEWLDEESGHPHTVLAAANLMFIHEFHGSEFDTLHELVGPALRNKTNFPVGKRIEFPDGHPLFKVTVDPEEAGVETINYGDPEPPRNTTWRDTEGDVWSYHTGRYGEGWCYCDADSECDDPTSWPHVIDSNYFPWTRVS